MTPLVLSLLLYNRLQVYGSKWSLRPIISRKIKFSLISHDIFSKTNIFTICFNKINQENKLGAISIILVNCWINGNSRKGRFTQIKCCLCETPYSGGAINPKTHLYLKFSSQLFFLAILVKKKYIYMI